MIRRYKYALLILLFLAQIHGALGQQSLTVFVDKGFFRDGGRDLINTWLEQLKRGYSCTVRYDSTGVFKGEGIYLTLTDRDRYRRAPVALRSRGLEACYIRSTTNGVYITANSMDGLQNALYLFLEKLGFRYYFPEPAWHIIPIVKKFPVINEVIEPSFANRQLAMGWGHGNPEMAKRFSFWETANRMGGWLKLRNEHAYYNLMIEKKDAFARHPEYLNKPLLNGTRQPGTVFNYGSEGLADLAHTWLAESFDNAARQGKPLPMLSLEPFDGGNYCNLPSCLSVGKTVSDQVFYFTNNVAKRLKRTHPGKKIGVLAYNDHIDVPSSSVQNNIFITLTTAYNQSNYTTDQLIERWRTKTKALGIYDYVGLFASSMELPGRGLGINYDRVSDQVKHFKARGVISYQAETTYGWITKGISHYLIARLTWNVKDDPQKIINGFFNDCFPSSKKWIEPVFRSWKTSHTLNEDDLYSWSENLKQAFLATNDPAEIERLKQVGLYLHYVRLYIEYSNAKGDLAKKLKSDLCVYLWNIMETGAVASYAGIHTLSGDLEIGKSVMEANAAWKRNRMQYPITKSQWLTYLDAYLPTLSRITGVKKYVSAPFLTPAELKMVPDKARWDYVYPRTIFHGQQILLIDTRSSDSSFLRISGGRIKKEGSVEMIIYPWNNELVPGGTPLKKMEFVADSVFRIASFSGLPKGKYIISLNDGVSGGQIYFPAGLKYSLLASPERPLLGGAGNYYIYVPKGTKKFYTVRNYPIRLVNPKGVNFYADGNEKIVELSVADDEWGWWLCQLQLETTYFVGIPPLVSQQPKSFFFAD